MKKEVNPITTSIDTLWTITIFYALYQLNTFRDYWPILIGILTTLLLINEWFSVRATFNFYTGPMFFADVFDVFLYICAYSALKAYGSLTYSNTYWLCLSLIWFVYFIWDVSVLPFTLDEGAAKSLKKWKYSMLFASIFTFGTYLFFVFHDLQQLSFHYSLLIQILKYANLIIIVVVLYAWNKKKIATIQKAFHGANLRSEK